ncbi:MAG: PP2C family protein-serine/threonine phosphatase [Planctomycetota bacterium]
MTSPPVVQYASRTDVGMRRAANQDSLAVRLCTDYPEWAQCGHLFVVADGMGGHAVGDLASRIAVDTLPHAYSKSLSKTIEQRLRESIAAANKAINDRGRENREFEGMGTTCSVLSLSERGAIIGHVGDSRIYRVRQGVIEQLTFDHSLQWEMIRLGRATAENVELFHPRNVITRCLGPDLSVQVDVEGPFPVAAGDRFLLCSDGLTNHVTDSEIGQILNSLPATDASRLLINLANCRGGSDNSTVIVVAVDSYPAPQIEIGQLDGKSTPNVDPVVIQRKGRRLWASLLSIVAVMLLLGGIGLALIDQKPNAAILIGASFIAWLLGRRVLPDPEPPSPADGMESGPVVTRTEAAQNELSGSSRSSFFPVSPYRVVEAVLGERLLIHLAEVQSELVQAARESGWKVDLNELAALGRQAIQNQQNGRMDRALKARAKAIDILMRELDQRSRMA